MNINFKNHMLSFLDSVAQKTAQPNESSPAPNSSLYFKYILIRGIISGETNAIQPTQQRRCAAHSSAALVCYSA